MAYQVPTQPTGCLPTVGILLNILNDSAKLLKIGIISVVKSAEWLEKSQASGENSSEE